MTLGVTDDQNYNDIADAIRAVGVGMENQTFTPGEMPDAIRGLRSYWGNIEGSLENQTDLQNALNQKADSADLGSMAEVDDAPSDHKTYGRKDGEWRELDTSLVEWGEIGGDLANQTDLKQALDEKADAADLGTMAEVDDAPSDGKQYVRKNAEWAEIKEIEWGNIVGDLEDQTDLQNALNEKLDAKTVELTGDIITFEAENDHAIENVTVAIEPVQDLHGYDNPWPGGGGANLLPVTANSSIWKGVNFSYTNGVITINGTAEDNGGRTVLRSSFFTLEAGTYYFNCFNQSGAIAGAYIQDGNTILTSIYGSFTVGTTSSNINLGINVSAGAVNYSGQFTITKTAVNSFTPPENICPISGWDTANVTRTGINIWDEEWERADINWNTYVFVPKPNGTRLVSKNYISVVPNTTYYAYLDRSHTALAGYSDNSGNGGRSLAIDPISKKFTVPSDVRYIKFGINTANYGTTYNHDMSINYPATDTQYHASHVRTAIIDLDGTRYGGQLDLTGGKMLVTHQMADLGTLSWTYVSGSTRFYSSDLASVIKAPATNSETVEGTMSSQYRYVSLNDMGVSTTDDVVAISATKNVYIKDLDYTDVSFFTTAMSGVQLVYPLAQPFEVTLTSTQISSIIGTNHIWADAGATTVTLRKSTGDLAYQDTVDYEIQVTNKPDLSSKADSDTITYTETAMKATRNYTTGDLICVAGGDLYRATANIASNANLTVGTNVVTTTIDAELKLRAKSADVYTKSQVYTKTETDTALALKADKSDTYTKAEIEYVAAQSNEAIVKHIENVSIASFDDGVNNIPAKDLKIAIEPVQDLHGYDNPWPGGGGSNIFDVKTWLTIGNNSKYYTVANDETITITQSDVSGVTLRLFDIEASQTFSVYYTGFSQMQVFNSSSQNILAEGATTFTSPSDGKIAVKFLANSFPTSGKAIIVKGSTAPTAWSPYANICPISGHTSATVTKTGVNLFDVSSANVGKAIMADGSLANSSTRITSDYIKVHAGNYYGTAFVTGAEGRSCATYDAYKNFKRIIWFSNSSADGILTINEGETYIRVQGLIANQNSIQLEEGSSASPYTPYKGQRVTIDLDGTRYGGELDVTSGKMLVTKVGVDMGTLSWSYFNIANHLRFVAYPQGIKDFGSSVLADIICSTYTVDKANNIFNNVTDKRIGTGGGVLFVYDTDYTDATTFKTAVTGQTLVYELAEPFEVQLTPTQITTLLNENRIWADTGDILNLDYVIDTESYIQKNAVTAKAPVITESASGSIVSIDDGAEDMPLESLIVNVEPVQDLHGYNAPWPAGGGKNAFPLDININDSTYYHGYSLANYPVLSQFISFLTANIGQTAVWSVTKTGTSASGTYVIGTIAILAGGNVLTSFTPDTAKTIPNVDYSTATAIAIYGSGSGATVKNCQFELGSTATAYAPYENICPITGWNSATVTGAGDNLIDADTLYSAFKQSDGSFLGIAISVVTVKVHFPQSLVGKELTFSAEIKVPEGSNLTNPRVRVSVNNVNYEGAFGASNYTLSSVTFTPQSTSDWFNITYGSYGSDNVQFRNVRLSLATITSYVSPTIRTLTIPFGQTVYGAEIDVLAGEMRVTHAYADLGDFDWLHDYNGLWRTGMGLMPDTTKGKFIGSGVCSNYKWVQKAIAGNLLNNESSITNSQAVPILRVRDDANLIGKTAVEVKTFLTGVKIAYELAVPFVILLSPQQMNTLLGVNNIWADTGDVSLEYRADTKLFIEKAVAEATRNTRKMIAGEEVAMKATKNYTIGDYLWVGDDLYKVTTNIANGGTITVGTNVQKCTVGEQLKLALS